jgi:hypothetical protein
MMTRGCCRFVNTAAPPSRVPATGWQPGLFSCRGSRPFPCYRVQSVITGPCCVPDAAEEPQMLAFPADGDLSGACCLSPAAPETAHPHLLWSDHGKGRTQAAPSSPCGTSRASPLRQPHELRSCRSGSAPRPWERHWRLSRPFWQRLQASRRVQPGVVQPNDAAAVDSARPVSQQQLVEKPGGWWVGQALP